MTHAMGEDRTGGREMGDGVIVPSQIEGNASATNPPSKKEKPNKLKRPSKKEKPSGLKRPNGPIKKRPVPNPPTK